MLVAAGLALVGAFLPWVTIATVFGSLSRNGMDGDGRASAAAGIAVGLIALMMLDGKIRSSAPAVVVVVVSAAIFVVGLVDARDVAGRFTDLQATGVGDAQVGVGLWVTCLAGLVGIAGGLGTFIKP